MKCSEKAVVLARVKDAFCRDCFLAYVTHRFKATIGKSRLVREKEKVLVAFSGGQNSCAVLNLIAQGLAENQHKKLRFVPSLVYIDDGVVIQQSDEERHATRQTIARLMQESGFPSCIVPLEEVLKLEILTTTTQTEGKKVPDVAIVTDQLDDLSINRSLTQRLLDILASAKSFTAKEDLVHNMRRRLLAHLARQKGHTKVMVGDNGTRLASRVLASMAQGRGVTVPLDVGFADDREGDIMFIRPLREFPSREVAMYNRLSNVDSVCVPTITTKAGQYASINALTNEFINGLQVSFPSTVSTVFRTGEKLCTVNKPNEDADCVMCKGPLDTDVPECSALEATQHSLSISGSGDQKLLGSCTSSSQSCSTTSGVSSQECCGEGDGSCHSIKKTISPEQLSRWLCYGCRITIREMKQTSLLPDYVLQEAARRQRRSEMKSEIEDFLITDDDR